MPAYNHILVAVDLTDESQRILEKAASLAKINTAKLSILHVIEPINFAYGGDIPVDLSAIQEQMDEHARARLAELSGPFNIDEDNKYIVVGLPKSEIHRIATEGQVDLIVVGSHGKNGLALLLGSTATGVLHAAECDVLAVRVG